MIILPIREIVGARVLLSNGYQKATQLEVSLFDRDKSG